MKTTLSASGPAALGTILLSLAGCAVESAPESDRSDDPVSTVPAATEDTLAPQVKDPRADPGNSCLNGGGAWHVDGYSTSTTTYTDNGVVSYRVCQRTRYSCEGGSYGGALSWSSGGCTDLS